MQCCFLSIILLFVLENRITLQNNNSSNINSIEIIFWRKLIKQDRLLTTEERLKRIELVERKGNINKLNWTNIFYNIYKEKIKKLNQKDMNNGYKYSIIENGLDILQDTFEIFEETLVRICFSINIE